MSGLGSANLRVVPPAPEPEPDAIDVDVSDMLDSVDPEKNLVEIELPDGSVTINLGSDLAAGGSNQDTTFDANLADQIDDVLLAQIADELIRGIDDDNQSRSEWLETRAEGIKMLGFQLESPSSSGAAGSAPLEGMSRFRHPILAEAAIRFQANARGELLPADGPVKVRNDDPNSTPAEDNDGDALERDMNHYLTSTDKDYYPDTDRMLFWVGFGGCGFKKIYHDPLKRRPKSASVAAEDLIVSNAAIDLASAPRITQRFFMNRSMLKRMQIVGAYRDVDIPDQSDVKRGVVDEAKDAVSGVTPSLSGEAKDRELEFYETYCDLNIPGFEHKDKGGKETGLAVPYKVTIAVESKMILEVRRNWDADDELCMPCEVFVKYPFLPAIGFYDLGLLHILGNTAMAATAGVREGLDAGMFANFPGFLYSKQGGKQNSMDFRVAPGSGAQIDTAGGRIQDFVMPLPYKEMGPGMMQLLESIISTGQRVGGTAETNVGEGRQDAPVGTTIALIEQATKPMDAVHKRIHAAQAREFELLVDKFREDPESFSRGNKRPAKEWNKDQLLRALDNYDLVPAADPNVSSSMQRIGKAQALYQLAKDDPAAFDVTEVRKVVLRAMGWGQPDAFLNQNQQAAAPDPKAEAALIAAQAAQTNAQAKLQDTQLRAKNIDVENENRDQDRAADLHIADTKLQTEKLIHGAQLASDHALQDKKLGAEDVMHQRGVAADLHSSGQELAQERQLSAGGFVADHVAQTHDRQHDMVALALEHAHAEKIAKLNAEHKPKSKD